MNDLLYLGITVAFFIGSGALCVRFCEQAQPRITMGNLIVGTDRPGPASPTSVGGHDASPEKF